ncbi:hypothetical protein O9992_26015 [Vibrio lentus]|nr:hypothetical protein [Vibrio lentus]
MVQAVSDSPYSFKDIATHLAEQHTLVRTPYWGHGSQVKDLMQPNLGRLAGRVAYIIRSLLEQEKDSVGLAVIQQVRTLHFTGDERS